MALLPQQRICLVAYEEASYEPRDIALTTWPPLPKMQGHERGARLKAVPDSAFEEAGP